jgi:hypothetical protein
MVLSKYIDKFKWGGQETMKRLIKILLTIIIFIGITYALAHYTNGEFIDYSFFTGLIFSSAYWFFTSSGGFTTDVLDVSVQGTTGTKMEKQKYKFSPDIVFLTSAAYTIISLVLFLVYYKSSIF